MTAEIEKSKGLFRRGRSCEDAESSDDEVGDLLDAVMDGFVDPKEGIEILSSSTKMPKDTLRKKKEEQKDCGYDTDDHDSVGDMLDAIANGAIDASAGTEYLSSPVKTPKGVLKNLKQAASIPCIPDVKDTDMNDLAARMASKAKMDEEYMAERKREREARSKQVTATKITA